MDRQQLEKLFDEKFDDYYFKSIFCDSNELKQFIFDTVIPEVIKSVVPYYTEKETVQEIKKRAKDLYGITL